MPAENQPQLERLKWIRERFAAGDIAPEDLLQHLEPALGETAPVDVPAATIRVLVNQVERIVYTENEPNRSVLLAKSIDEAIRLATR